MRANLNRFGGSCKCCAPKAEGPVLADGALLKLVSTNSYFGAGVAAGVEVLLCDLLWWCLCLPEVLVLGVEAGAVSAANTGPAIRANATTGMSFLNIDVVSRIRGSAASPWRVPDRLMCVQDAHQPGRLPVPKARVLWTQSPTANGV